MASFACKRMLHALVASLLKECAGEQQSLYVLEELVPTLIPALVELTQAYERGKTGLVDSGKEGVVVGVGGGVPAPVDFVASFLYRNNPRFEQSSAKVDAHRALVKQVIAQEHLSLAQGAFLRNLERDVASGLGGLGVWPEGADCVRLRGADARQTLDALEWETGIVGLADELLVVFEALDVRNSGVLQWGEVVYTLESWLEANPDRKRAKPTRAFGRWLLQEVRAKVELGVEAHFGTTDAAELARTAALQHVVEGPDASVSVGASASAGAENVSASACLRLMREITGSALRWTAKQDYSVFEPEDVLDARETKCTEDDLLSTSELQDVLSTFTQRLAQARVDHFFNICID